MDRISKGIICQYLRPVPDVRLNLIDSSYIEGVEKFNSSIVEMGIETSTY